MEPFCKCAHPMSDHGRGINGASSACTRCSCRGFASPFPREALASSAPLTGPSRSSLVHFREMAEREMARAEAHRARGDAAEDDDVRASYAALASAAEAAAAQWEALAAELEAFADATTEHTQEGLL